MHTSVPYVQKFRSLLYGVDFYSSGVMADGTSHEMYCAMCLGLLCRWESFCSLASSTSIEIFYCSDTVSISRISHRHRIDFSMLCVFVLLFLLLLSLLGG